jgi:lipopolysaccharide/colanic/teichoic acid biosynthesis glycosyltransferase
MYAKNTLGPTLPMSTSPYSPRDNPPPATDESTPEVVQTDAAGFPVDMRVDPELDRGPYLRAGKRTIDILVSFVLLLLLSPIFAVATLAIKLGSPGPVLFRCKRVKKSGDLFEFWKFRSMRAGAECDKSSLLHMNEVDGPVFKVANDPRITPVGRWLRRTSIDELPQLVHVLRGDMTLVGPRPPEPQEVLEYEPWQLRRLSVKPGLTCLWQISGRSLIGFEEWMRLDLEYIDNRSFSMDLRILLRTLPAVISGRGAF